MGRLTEAEALYKHCLAIREKSLGKNHPDVAQSARDLGDLYIEEGRHVDAEAFGPDSPAVAPSLHGLGELYRVEGRYADAKPLLKRFLAIRENEKSFGPNTNVAASLNSLAQVYGEQGQHAEAERFYKRSLALYQKAFGPDHPYIAAPLNNLAWVYSSERRYPEAASTRVFTMLAAVTGMSLRPQDPNEPFGATFMFSGGRRSAQLSLARAGVKIQVNKGLI